jgi:hypothetical protein
MVNFKTLDMKTTWFRQFGIFYIPVHLFGYLVTMLAIVLMVTVALSVFKGGQPLTTDLFQFFIYLTCTAFWWKWIADKTSEK